MLLQLPPNIPVGVRSLGVQETVQGQAERTKGSETPGSSLLPWHASGCKMAPSTFTEAKSALIQMEE